MKQLLRERFAREQFQPTWLGLLVNPFWFARRGLWRHMAKLAPRLAGCLLDVGCGQKPYAALFSVEKYIGLEMDTPANRAAKKADCFYGGDAFPFGDAEFDSVVANQVFEHVFNPDPFLAEVFRVMKPEGLLLLTVPFAWDEHEQPHDFARYTSFGLRAILETHGFTIIEQHKSVDDIRAVFQLLNAYLYKKTVADSKLLTVLATLFLIAPWSVLGELVNFILPRNEDFYLDNVILARKTCNA